MLSPLADRLRPETLDELVGQKHILGEGKALRKLIEAGITPNLIFYGPSGTGKTTVARMIAKTSGKRLHILNGTNTSLAEIKAVVSEIGTLGALSGILLYLDEIQYLNKKQQQSILEYIETGDITLIASTTENPYFYIYNAVLSRSTVFEFKPVPDSEIELAIIRAFAFLEEEQSCKFILEEGCAKYIAKSAGGDVRKALNAIELAAIVATVNPADPSEKNISLDDVKGIASQNAMRYDRGGDEQYDMMSALQKSIRGSDENAAIYYLARILSAGDLISACRRLLVIASEDIGLAWPACAVTVKACVDSALQLGLPEGRIPLAHATILMATAPKSNSAYMAIAEAMAAIEETGALSPPRTLQNKHFDGEDVKDKGQFYVYPHDHPNHYVKQQYLPDKLKDRVFFEYGESKFEKSTKAYWDKIK